MSFKKNQGITVVLAILAVVFYLSIDFNENKVNLPNLLTSSDLENVTTSIQNTERAIQYYLAEIEKNPKEVGHYLALTQHYLTMGRSTGQEINYTNKAENMISKAIELNPNNALALATRAAIFAAKHRFEEAIPVAEKAIQQNPHLAYAYGVLVDSYIELGNYDQAVALCDKMIGIRPDLRSYSRASYLRELHGDLDGAIEAMKLAADTGMAGHENRAWALFYLGDLFLDKGDLKTAEFIFAGVLQEIPGYVHALTGLAEIKMAQEKYDEAISILLHAYEISPDHGILELLANVYFATGKKIQADNAIQKLLNIFENFEHAGWNIDMEYAAFCADFGVNLNEALIRVKREFNRRPNNIEVVETYAWVLFKNGRVEDATGLIEQAMRLKTKDAKLYFRAGQIFKAFGQLDKSQEYFAIAQKVNPSYRALLM